jgi:hypothetical protein
MRKGSSSHRCLKQVAKAGHTRSMTIGVDLGDKNSCYCVLDSNGVIIEESRVGTTKASISLRPRRSESGESQPQLRITKEGDAYLRKMLVQGAHYILGHRGPDTDLKRWGLKLAGRGGKRGKESSGHCSGTKIRHLAAPVVGDGRSLRTPAKREPCSTHEKG